MLRGARYGFDPLTWEAVLVATVPTYVDVEPIHPSYGGERFRASGRARISLVFRNAGVPCRWPFGFIFFVVPVPDPALHVGRCSDVTGSVQLASVRDPVSFTSGRSSRLSAQDSAVVGMSTME